MEITKTEAKKDLSTVILSILTTTRLLPPGLIQIDTPNDHNCLFWSAALALLMPLLGEGDSDKANFKAMYICLFGTTGTMTLQGGFPLLVGADSTQEGIRQALKTYNFSKQDPLSFVGNPLYALIAEKFRHRVVGKLLEVFPTKTERTDIAAEYGGDWDKYVERMCTPSSSWGWGGEPEIRAISRLVGVNVVIYGEGSGYPKNYPLLGASQSLCLVHVNADSKLSTVKNHYHYGIADDIYRAHMQNLRTSLSSSSTLVRDKKEISDSSKSSPLLVNTLGELIIPKKEDQVRIDKDDDKESMGDHREKKQEIVSQWPDTDTSQSFTAAKPSTTHVKPSETAQTDEKKHLSSSLTDQDDSLTSDCRRLLQELASDDLTSSQSQEKLTALAKTMLDHTDLQKAIWHIPLFLNLPVHRQLEYLALLTPHFTPLEQNTPGSLIYRLRHTPSVSGRRLRTAQEQEEWQQTLLPSLWITPAIRTIPISLESKRISESKSTITQDVPISSVGKTEVIPTVYISIVRRILHDDSWEWEMQTYPLKPFVTKQLFLGNGKWRLKDHTLPGNHQVFSIKIGGQRRFWVKAYPENPSNEWLIYQLDRRLGAFSTPRIELVKFHHGGQTSAALISENVTGKTLREVIEVEPDVLALIDFTSFMQTLFRVLLTHPEDDKDDDYFLEKQADGRLCLKRIDNERYFVTPFQENGTSIWMHSEGILQVKSIIYCLEQMRQPWPVKSTNSILEDWRHIKPEPLIRDLLLETEQQQIAWRILFSLSEVQSHFTRSDSEINLPSLPLMFIPRNFAQEMIVRLINLQNILRSVKKKEATYVDIPSVEICTNGTLKTGSTTVPELKSEVTVAQTKSDTQVTYSFCGLTLLLNIHPKLGRYYANVHWHTLSSSPKISIRSQTVDHRLVKSRFHRAVASLYYRPYRNLEKSTKYTSLLSRPMVLTSVITTQGFFGKELIQRLWQGEIGSPKQELAELKKSEEVLLTFEKQKAISGFEQSLHSPLMTIADFRDQVLNSEEIHILAMVLITPSSLKELHLDRTQITDAAVAVLAEALSQNTRLITLSLTGNPKLTKASVIFRQQIEAYLYRNRLLAASSIALIELQSVDLEMLKSEDIYYLLDHHKNLEVFDFSNKKLTGDSLILQPQSLPFYPNLKRLNLSFNKLEDKGTQQIALLFKSGTNPLPHLVHLFLRNNRIKDLGFRYLADAMSDDLRLETVDLRENFIQISDATLKELSTLFDRNKHLKTVRLGGNNLFESCDTLLNYDPYVDDVATESPKEEKKESKKTGLMSFISTTTPITFFHSKPILIKSVIKSEKNITREKWVVALGCQKGDQHAMLYLEGMRASGQRFIERYHIVAPNVTFVGKAIVQTESLEPKRLVQSRDRHDFLSFEIDRIQGETLKSHIRDQQESRIPFSKFYNSTTSTVNCTGWCQNELMQIGIETPKTPIPSLAAQGRSSCLIS